MWAAFSTYWYTCKIKGVCKTAEHAATQPPAENTSSSRWIVGPSASDCASYLSTNMHKGADAPRDQIKKLEHFLNAFEGASIPEDGIYGEDNAAAVKDFQTHYKALIGVVNGSVGPRTRAVINRVVCNAAKSAETPQKLPHDVKG